MRVFVCAPVWWCVKSEKTEEKYSHFEHENRYENKTQSDMAKAEKNIHTWCECAENV